MFSQAIPLNRFVTECEKDMVCYRFDRSVSQPFLSTSNHQRMCWLSAASSVRLASGKGRPTPVSETQPFQEWSQHGRYSQSYGSRKDNFELSVSGQRTGCHLVICEWIHMFSTKSETCARSQNFFTRTETLIGSQTCWTQKQNKVSPFLVLLSKLLLGKTFSLHVKGQQQELDVQRTMKLDQCLTCQGQYLSQWFLTCIFSVPFIAFTQKKLSFVTVLIKKV